MRRYVHFAVLLFRWLLHVGGSGADGVLYIQANLGVNEVHC